ncbi:hypothetical protein [Ferruginibacter sp.]|nr:hypothetical protein [Ferruginibacter sp.]
MKKLALYFLVSTAIIFFTSCKKSPPVPPVNTEVEIRVKNATPWIFYDCTVNAYNYGSVNIDAVSAYKTFAKAYRYASIALSMNGKPYSIIPIDNVGETSLANGKYTYKLTYSATDDRLNMELIKD